MTPEEEIRISEATRQLIEAPPLKEAFSFVREALISGIELSSLKDSSLRESICQELIALSAVKRHLTSAIETGKLAERQIEQQNMWDKAKNIVGIR